MCLRHVLALLLSLVLSLHSVVVLLSVSRSNEEGEEDKGRTKGREQEREERWDGDERCEMREERQDKGAREALIQEYDLILYNE